MEYPDIQSAAKKEGSLEGATLKLCEDVTDASSIVQRQTAKPS